MPKVTAEKILLGHGVITVGTTPLGLTRGGGVFAVEREYREIEADGDRGPVKGRIVIDREVAKLTVNALELFNAEDMQLYYPAIDVTEGSMTSTLKIVAGDYNDVKWEGKTKDGKSVTIEIDDAINLENLEWALEDKNEVVPSLGFTGAYDEESRDTPPWRVIFEPTAAYAVTFTITSDGSTPIEGASVKIYTTIKTTDDDGKAIFSLGAGTNIPFTVTKGGYEIFNGAIDVTGVTSETVTMDSI